MGYFTKRPLPAPSMTMKRCLDWIRCHDHPLYGDILEAGYTSATVVALWNRGLITEVPTTAVSGDIRLTEYRLTSAGYQYHNKIVLSVLYLRR